MKRLDNSGSREIVAHNIRVHDRIARAYARVHGEIYNGVEQQRIAETLRVAVSRVESTAGRPLVLDFGCGAGNLTAHLSTLGTDVIAADVAPAFLGLVRSQDYSGKVETLELNGKDLSALSNCSVDMVATYSVLHHVPDYLAMVREFTRVLRPGGVIYIDHELSEEYWRHHERYCALRRHLSSPWALARKYLRPISYAHWFRRRFIDPRFSPEGDIHVYHDDHVQWDAIREVLTEGGCEVVVESDYLLYRRGYVRSRYEEASEDYGDMHFVIAFKPLLS